MDDLPVLTVWGVLGWCAVGGALGGLLDCFRRLKFGAGGFTLDEAGVGFWALMKLSVLAGALGIGGALAVQLILLAAKQFSNDASVANQLFIFTLSLVSGFGARNILPMITRKLEREIDEVRRESHETSEDVKEVITFSKVMESLKPDAPASERAWGISELSKYAQEAPTNRTFAILLGRLHRANQDLQAGINALDNFLRAKDQANERDKDYADALYNRACYETLLWKDTDETSHKEQAYRDLAASLEISQANQGDATVDPDFKILRSEQRFQDLTKGLNT